VASPAKKRRGGLGLGGLVREEARPCFPYFTGTLLKRTDAGSTNCPLIQLVPSINYSVRKNTAVLYTPKFIKFHRMSYSSPYVVI